MDMIDLASVFDERVLDLGLGPLAPAFKLKHWTTLAKFAFGTGYAAGDPEERFVTLILSPLGAAAAGCPLCASALFFASGSGRGIKHCLGLFLQFFH